jgi:biopolymer transport protein ExbD
MRARTRFLATALTLACGANATAQSLDAIEIRISATSCFISDSELACRDIGAKLLSMHVPTDREIHLKVDKSVSYDSAHSALESLQLSGYSTKVGFINDESSP